MSLEVKLWEGREMAWDLFILIEDKQFSGPSKQLTGAISPTLAAKQYHLLEIQNAACKVLPCSQYPEIWAWTAAHMVSDLCIVFTLKVEFNKMSSTFNYILSAWCWKCLVVSQEHPFWLRYHGVCITTTSSSVITYFNGFINNTILHIFSIFPLGVGKVTVMQIDVSSSP